MPIFKQAADFETLAVYKKKLKSAMAATLATPAVPHEFWLYPEHTFDDARDDPQPLFLVDFSASMVKQTLGDAPVKGQLQHVREEMALTPEKGKLNRRKLNTALKALKAGVPPVQLNASDDDDGAQPAPARPAAAAPTLAAAATPGPGDTRRAALEAELARVSSALPAAVPPNVGLLLQRIRQDLDKGQLDKADLALKGLIEFQQRPKAAPVRAGFGPTTGPAMPAGLPTRPLPAQATPAAAGAAQPPDLMIEARRTRIEARRAALHDALGQDLPTTAAQALVRLKAVLARTDLKQADLDGAEQALEAVTQVIARGAKAPAGFAGPAAAAAAPVPPWHEDVVKAEGIESWFLDKPARSQRVEKMSEEFHAFLSLIDMKAKGKDMSALMRRVGKGPNAALNADGRAGVAIGKQNAKELGEAWKDFKNTEREKDALRVELKSLWLADQKKRMTELGHKAQAAKKSSPSHDMARAYGEEQMLEMAQMAEVQAANPGMDPNRDADKLDTGEKAAIYGYSTADYTEIGQLLRADNPDPAQQRKYAAYIECGVAGLAKLPPVPASMKLVRCDKTFWAAFAQDLVRTGLRVERSFMSSGTSKIPGFGDLEMHISGIKTGKNIKMFSLHQKEDEVLFPPGATFKLVDCEFTTADGRKVKAAHHSELKEADLLAARSGVFNYVQVS